MFQQFSSQPIGRFADGPGGDYQWPVLGFADHVPVVSLIEPSVNEKFIAPST